MNILVCAKQVPDTTEIKIDPVKNTLIREGVPSIMNTFDTFALETALRLKDENEDIKVYVVSMGPPQAEAILKEALAVGVDDVFLVTDRAFGGSDTLATSYILSCAVKAISEKVGNIDVILCGKQAIDGDTAQVGPEMAEHLDIPQATYGIEVKVDGDKVQIKQETDTGYKILEMQTPCLATMTKTAYDLRLPNIKMKLKARKATVNQITAADLDIDLTRAGLKGSPTKVKKTFTPDQTKNGIILEVDENAEEIVDKLIAMLQENKIL